VTQVYPELAADKRKRLKRIALLSLKLGDGRGITPVATTNPLTVEPPMMGAGAYYCVAWPQKGRIDAPTIILKLFI